jgi:TonB-like protein
MTRIPSILWLVLVLNMCYSAVAQDKSSETVTQVNQWQTFSPITGGFQIQFPDKPSERIGSVEVGGQILKTYEYSTRRVAEYRVTYFSLPPNLRTSGPGLIKGLANSLIAEHKGSVASEKEYSIQGRPGRIIEVKTASGAAIHALFLVTDYRAYRVTATIPRQSAPDKLGAVALTATKFLESFAIIPIVPSAEDSKYLVTEEGEVDRFLKAETVHSGSPIDQGALNGKAVKMATPHFPLGMPKGPFSETVEVKIVVDETGRVVAAQVVKGYPMLRSTSLEAARQTRFTPTLIAGKPVKVMGKIIYTFVR